MNVCKRAVPLIMSAVVALLAACSKTVAPADLRGYWYAQGDSYPYFSLDGEGAYTFYSPYGEEGMAGRYEFAAGVVTFFFSDGYEMFTFEVKDRNNMVAVSSLGSGASYIRRDGAVFVSRPPDEGGNMLSGRWYLDGDEGKDYFEFHDNGEVYMTLTGEGKSYFGLYAWDGVNAVLTFAIDSETEKVITLAAPDENTFTSENGDAVYVKAGD